MYELGVELTSLLIKSCFGRFDLLNWKAILSVGFEIVYLNGKGTKEVLKSTK
jgi:hypothetical protein